MDSINAKAATSLSCTKGVRQNTLETPDFDAPQEHWLSPAPSIFKFNADASTNLNLAGAAAIDRDSEERVLRVAATCVNSIDPELTETESILLSLKLATESSEQ